MVDGRTVDWAGRTAAADILGQGEKAESSLAVRSELHRVCSVA